MIRIPDPEFFKQYSKTGEPWLDWAKKTREVLSKHVEDQVYQLPTHESTDLPSAEQEGLLIFKGDTQKVSASFGGAWNDVAFVTTANTWLQAQTFYTADAFGAPVVLKSDNVSASSSPILLLSREPSDGVASVNDVGAGVLWRGLNAVGEIVDYGFNFLGLLNVTDGTETGHLVWNMINNGVITNNFSIGNGVRIGVPTGGYLGAGLLNAAGPFHINGGQVVRQRMTGWAVDTGSAKRTANATYSGTASAGYVQAELQAVMDALRDATQTIKALKDDLHATAGHGLIGT